LSRSGKMLSTFEFWLELNRRCRGKTLPGVVNKLLFSVQYKTDTKENMVFSVALLSGAKIQMSLHYRILTRFHQGFLKSFVLYLMVIWVVEEYKIRQIFGQKLISSKGNYCTYLFLEITNQLLHQIRLQNFFNKMERRREVK